MSIYSEMRVAYREPLDQHNAMFEALSEHERVNDQGKEIPFHELTPQAQQKVVDYAPTYWAKREAEAAEAAAIEAEQRKNPAARHLTELETMIEEGIQVSAAALAQAQAEAKAEADAAELAAKGSKRRASAVKDAAKRRREAIAEAKRIAPSVPELELSRAMQGARDAIDRVKAVAAQYNQGIIAMHATLAAGGVPERPHVGEPEPENFNWDTHGFPDGHTVNLEGKTYRPITNRYMGQLARYAAPGIENDRGNRYK